MQLKFLNVIHKTNKRRLWGREEANQLGTWGPMEQHSGEFPGFSFCIVYHVDRELKKPVIQKCQRGQTEKKKRPCSFKGPRKEHRSKTENIYTITTELQQKATENKLWSTPTQDCKVQAGSLIFQSHQAVMLGLKMTPQLPTCRGNIKGRTFFPVRW